MITPKNFNNVIWYTMCFIANQNEWKYIIGKRRQNINIVQEIKIHPNHQIELNGNVFSNFTLYIVKKLNNIKQKVFDSTSKPEKLYYIWKG